MTAQLPPLAAVRAFEAAARLMSFTDAARTLGMTQAAVSYQIKLLEERVGVPLFHRLGRRVELTPQGQALAPAIIAAFDQMRAGFASLNADSAAVLTISCSTSMAHLWLAPNIGQFQMLRPDLAVRIHTADALSDFVSDGVDVAIRGGAGPWPALDAHLLARNRIAPVCAPDLLDRIGPLRVPGDLLAAPRISPEDYWWDEWFAAMKAGTDGDVGIRPGLVLDSQVLWGRAAMAGQGIAIVNPFMWRRELEAGLLAEPIPSRVIEQARYWVVCPHANRNQPKIKLFREWILAQFAAARAADPEERFIPAL